MVYRLCTFCVPKYKYDKYLWIQIDTNKYAQSVLSLYFHGIWVRIDTNKYNKSCIFVFGNNPMVGMTVAVAVAIEESAKEGKF